MTEINAEILNQYFRKNFHSEATFSVASSGLMPEELNQKDFKIFKSFKSEKRKEDFLMGRKALYAFFDDPKKSDFIGFTHQRYSLTHSKGYAVAYDSGGELYSGVGVDLEFWRESLFKSRHLYSTKDEWGICQDDFDYLKLWVAKEAIYKAFGCNHLRLLDICLKNITSSSIFIQNRKVTYCTFQNANRAISAAYVE